MTLVGAICCSKVCCQSCEARREHHGANQHGLRPKWKRLELLKEAFPKISRVTVFVDGAFAAQQISEALQETQLAAGALGIKLHSLEVRGPTDLDGAFKTANE